MAVIKCKMCGGDLVLMEGQSVAECEFCGSRQTVPASDNEKKLTLFGRAHRLRTTCDFDKAAGIYETIIADFPDEAEAYWGLVLCKYGIEYVDDPVTAEKIPTCHRASFVRLQDHENYKAALARADYSAKWLYEKEAARIDGIMADVLDISRNEPPYDIFICYKETDAVGQRTVDSVLAQDLYDALTQKGYRVFFARITLEDKLGRQYEPYIFAALNSAKIMLVVGTSYEHFTAVWVQNEWSRFLRFMAKDKSKLLIPCYKDMDAYDLPDQFKMLQAQDLGKIGATQDLLRGIDKVTGKNLATPVSTPSVNPTEDSPSAPPQEQSVESLRANGPALIYNVCAIGSNSFTDCWPKGQYAKVFNYDQYHVVYFHMNVTKSALSHLRSIKTGMRIYNSDGVVVFDDVSDMDWQYDYDRIAKSWVIRGRDGSFVPTGTYKAEFWVENSRTASFMFTVTSTEALRRNQMALERERMKQGVCVHCGGCLYRRSKK